MYGLLEVDVTVARRFIAEHKALAGETLSFTGFLAYCLAARWMKTRQCKPTEKALNNSSCLTTWTLG